jgi:hypothetical protein
MCKISCKFFFIDNEHRFTILSIKMAFMDQCSTTSLSVLDAADLCTLGSFFKKILSTFKAYYLLLRYIEIVSNILLPKNPSPIYKNKLSHL